MDALKRRYPSHRRDEAQLWQTEAFGGLDLLCAHLVEFTFSPHTHEEFMIAVTESGKGSPRFWGGVQWVGPDDVFVLSPGEMHSGGPAKDSVWRYRAFYPPVALMRRVAQELTGIDRGIPQIAEEVFNDPDDVTMLRRAHIALEKPGSTLERESRLIEALARVLAHHGVAKLPAHRVGLEHRSVKLAKEYLESLPSENVSLEMLAREAGLSPAYLCAVFHRETGLSPHAYQILVRVKIAKTLLAKGVPISHVAVEAGFCDQAHLTRHFKRVFGVTPGQYLSHAGCAQSMNRKVGFRGSERDCATAFPECVVRAD